MRHNGLAKITRSTLAPLALALACSGSVEGSGAGESETSGGEGSDAGGTSAGPGAGTGGSGTGSSTTGTSGASTTEPGTAGASSSGGASAGATSTGGGSTGGGSTGEPATETEGAETETGTGTETETDSETGGALDDVLTLDHAQVKGTHNSYHLEPLIPFDASHEYSHAPLDVQLDEQGVRAFELDVHKDVNDNFEVYHIAVIDAETTCDSFVDCLETIKGWSDQNPLHLPIFVWIEIKDETGGLPIDGEDLIALEDEIRGTFPEDQLFVPDDLSAGYASVREALEQEGWPTLGELRGQVMVILLSLGDHAEDLTSGFTTLEGRAMWARASPEQFGAPWAAVAKLGTGGQDVVDAHAHQLLIATNICGADEADAECFAELDEAKASGLHMLKDDFPAPVDGQEYFMDFPDGNPARCNPVTAPPECTSEALESL